MLKEIRPFIFSLAVIALGYASVVYAAPYFRQEAGLVPITDSTYYLGTTTPATKAWLGVITDELCLTGDVCRTTWPSGSPFAWTAQTWGVSTSTTLGFLNGFLSTASSTFTFAPKFSTLTSALLQTDANGLTEEYTGTTCTNQFVRSLSALGAATCATVGASDVSLAALTAGTGLSSAGTYTGATARTFTVDQSFTPTWTGAHIFDNITRSTTTSATTTSLFSTTASSTNLFSSVFTFGSSILSLAANTITAGANAILDFGGASSVEIPNGTAPTVDLAGELALDTTSNILEVMFEFSDGICVFFFTVCHASPVNF